MLAVEPSGGSEAQHTRTAPDRDLVFLAEPLFFSGTELQNLTVSVYDEDTTDYEPMGSATFALTQVQSMYVLDSFVGVVSITLELY